LLKLIYYLADLISSLVVIGISAGLLAFETTSDHILNVLTTSLDQLEEINDFDRSEIHSFFERIVCPFLLNLGYSLAASKSETKLSPIDGIVLSEETARFIKTSLSGEFLLLVSGKNQQSELAQSIFFSTISDRNTFHIPRYFLVNDAFLSLEKSAGDIGDVSSVMEKKESKKTKKNDEEEEEEEKEKEEEEEEADDDDDEKKVRATSAKGRGISSSPLLIADSISGKRGLPRAARGGDKNYTNHDGADNDSELLLPLNSSTFLGSSAALLLPKLEESDEDEDNDKDEDEDENLLENSDFGIGDIVSIDGSFAKIISMKVKNRNQSRAVSYTVRYFKDNDMSKEFTKKPDTKWGKEMARYLLPRPLK
jgi:hypothetical protein